MEDSIDFKRCIVAVCLNDGGTDGYSKVYLDERT